MHSALKQLKSDRGGATAIEYAMVALLISIAAVSVFVTIGSRVANMFSQIANGF